MAPLAALTALLAFPILEIATFIYVGQSIGVWKTIGLVLLSAVIGVAILRYQGLGVVRRINKDLKKANRIEQNLVNGFMIAIASILLIIPGFITDVIGLMLIVPPIRHFLWKAFGPKLTITSYTAEFHQRRDRPDDFVDLSPEDYRRTGEQPHTPRRLRDSD